MTPNFSDALFFFVSTALLVRLIAGPSKKGIRKLSLRQKLALFNSRLKIEYASVPPPSWFLENDFIELERKALFEKVWLPIARLNQLTSEGDRVDRAICSNQFTILRGKDNKLHAFSKRPNIEEILLKTQRHDDAHSAYQHELSYHQWSYDNGTNLSREQKFNLCAMDEIKSNMIQKFGPYVFLSIDKLAPSLAAIAPPDVSFLKMDTVLHHSTRSYEVEANWKFYISSYQDGVPVLCRGFDFKNYNVTSLKTELHENYIITTCEAMNPDDEGSSHLWIFPGFFISRFKHVMEVITCIPITPRRSLIVQDFYFDVTTMPYEDMSKFVQNTVATAGNVQNHYASTAQAKQNSLKDAISNEIYDPELVSEFHFHRWLHATLVKGVTDDLSLL